MPLHCCVLSVHASNLLRRRRVANLTFKPFGSHPCRIGDPGRTGPMKKWLLVGVVCLTGAAVGAQVPAAERAVELPKTPVGNALSEFLGAYNRADSTELRAFYRKYGLDRAMDAV